MPRLSVTHYNALNPEQRFIAALLAQSRGDDTEFERLVATCPRHCYRITDPAFTRLADKAYDIVRLIGYSIEQECARLSVVDVLGEPIAEMVDLLVDPSHEARGLPEPEPEEPLPAERDHLREWWDGHYEYAHTMMPLLHEICVRSIDTYWRAFERFCEECIGLAPELVLRAVLMDEGTDYLLAQVARARADMALIEARSEPMVEPLPARNPDLLPNEDDLLDHLAGIWGKLDWHSAIHRG